MVYMNLDETEVVPRSHLAVRLSLSGWSYVKCRSDVSLTFDHRLRRLVPPILVSGMVVSDVSL